MAEGTSYAKLIAKYLKKDINRIPTVPLPAIRTDLSKLTGDAIVWFGHSSYFLRIDEKNILVDPVFSERTSPFQSIGAKNFEMTEVYTAAQVPDIDLLIITHDHYDHLDYQTILDLRPRIKNVCTTLGIGAHLEHWGIDRARITELDWWDTIDIFDSVRLTSTPARHFSGRTLLRNKTLWSSFVLRSSKRNLFLGGDSGYDQIMFKSIGEKHGPFDLAILECGQYDEMWPTIHMMPEEAVKAAIDLNARALMPVHWGKFVLALHPWSAPVKRVTRYAALQGVNVTTPLIGEVVFLDHDYPRSEWWEKL